MPQPRFKKGDRVVLVHKDTFDGQGLRNHPIQIGDVVTVTFYDDDHTFLIDMEHRDDRDQERWWFKPKNFELYDESKAKKGAEPTPIVIPTPDIKDLFDKLRQIPDPKVDGLEASKRLGAILADLADYFEHTIEPIPPVGPKKGEVVTKENAVVGRKIRRGPDWEWGTQDGTTGSGTIVNIYEGGWLERGERYDKVRVKWDSGNTNGYRIGPVKYDLIFAD